MEGVREVWPEGEEWDGVGTTSRCSSSSLEESSSPMANAPLSSGTLLSVGVRAL